MNGSNNNTQWAYEDEDVLIAPSNNGWLSCDHPEDVASSWEEIMKSISTLLLKE